MKANSVQMCTKQDAISVRESPHLGNSEIRSRVDNVVNESSGICLGGARLFFGGEMILPPQLVAKLPNESRAKDLAGISAAANR
jgi:hypothetical protein